ncbi:TadE/TadG family type IV pilus assembly protein [Litorisediminicola beolgyonensis]|uniref:TadE/TadG family type IV pilus assembly protein n=1 Tax=Litorisediminicola beolgyonensis TaxID=1173614 RepID=A0ABW3ZJL9_9RHOB
MRDLITRFRRDEDGAMTAMSLYFVAIAAMVGGLAVDFAQRTERETWLQTATDAAGHAALQSRTTKSASAALSDALSVAAANLPVSVHGLAILPSDITFGSWDADTRTFSADATARDAVRVTGERSAARGNYVSNLLLHTLGYRGFELDTDAVFARQTPPCFREGFVAEARVDLQSNNAFGANFCIHGNDGVKLSSNSSFADGSVVSMLDPATLELPSSGMTSNPGLAEALRYTHYPFHAIDSVPDTIADLLAGGASVPGYISGLAGVTLPDRRLTPELVIPGRMHIALTCSGNQKLAIEAGHYDKFLLVTNCKVKFNQGVHLTDSVIATTNPDPKSLNAPSGLILGLDDSCAKGGGVTLLSAGGMEVASDLEIYGSQVVAMGDVTFSANATGIEGASIISGGTINSTSRIEMDGCPEDTNDGIVTEKIVRMVQ